MEVIARTIFGPSRSCARVKHPNTAGIDHYHHHTYNTIDYHQRKVIYTHVYIQHKLQHIPFYSLPYIFYITLSTSDSCCCRSCHLVHVFVSCICAAHIHVYIHSYLHIAHCGNTPDRADPFYTPGDADPHSLPDGKNKSVCGEIRLGPNALMIYFWGIFYF